MSKQPAGRLADVTGKNVDISPEAHYDDWAASYNQDLLDEYGYCAHRIAVEAFASRSTARDIAVLDVGCGTGLVGIELHRQGFNCIDGMDISANMLAQAGQLDLYRNLIHVDAEATDAPPKPVYDGVLSVGTFGRGHMGPDGMSKVAAHARPEGLIVLFMNAEPYFDMNFDAEIERLVTAAFWRLEAIEDHNYMDALARPGKLVIAYAAT